METRDLIVVGGGSGGVRAARLAAQSGAKTLLFESGALGGTCVNVGCVPKKLFVRAAGFADAVRAAASFGWKIESPPPFDWPLLRENKNREIARLNAAYEKTLAAAGVEIVKSRAVLDSENAVRDDGGKIHRARKILLATGSKPVRPDIPGAAGGGRFGRYVFFGFAAAARARRRRRLYRGRIRGHFGQLGRAHDDARAQQIVARIRRRFGAMRRRIARRARRRNHK